MAGENENTQIENSEEDKSENSQGKLIRLPISRIRHIMKMDPDVTLANQEAVIVLAKCTELFIQKLAIDSVHGTVQAKRKTLQRKDLDRTLDIKDCYAFLEGALD